MSSTPEATFRSLIARIELLVKGNASQSQSIAALYAERTHVTFPLTPSVRPLSTREELKKHFDGLFAQVSGVFSQFRAERVRVHKTADPEVIVAEFDYCGVSPSGAITLPNVFIMRVRGGEIIESRDYALSP